MKNVGKLVYAVVAIMLAGCSKEPRSEAWFADNIEEARAVSTACGGKIDPTDLISGDDECTNASVAVKRADGAAYRAKQQADDEAALKAGVRPKIVLPVK